MTTLSEGQANVMALVDQAKQALCDAIVRQNADEETVALHAWAQSIEALRLATRLTQTIREVPDATSRPEADLFRHAPVDQEELQTTLVGELAGVKREDIAVWYRENRTRLEKVQRADLRNPLFDAIRRKATGEDR